MSQPDPKPMKSRMNPEKFVMYSAVLGVLTQLVGWAIGSRVVIDIGMIGWLPLGLQYVVVFVVIIWLVIASGWKALTKAVSWCLGQPPSHGNDTQDQSQS